jgi:DNA-binding response OmpR family regulator
MEQKKLLYVEDETVIRDNFSEFFLANGFSVFAVDSEENALRLIASRHDFDCAVFDVELGDNPFGGIQLCRVFREKFPRVPILVLSAHTETDIQEMGYKLGIDAYLDKREPLSLLAIKLESLVRRYEQLLNGQKPRHNGLVESLAFDDLAERVYWNGDELSLSPVRFMILRYLVQAHGKAVSVFDIQEELNVVVESNTIVQHVKIIRQEFLRLDPEFNCIRTVRGKGYRWVNPVN